MSSVALIGVAKSWGATTALHAIDLEVAAGTFCCLLGPSGCGKTTTVRIVAGLETASAGRVLIDGRDVTALPPAERGVGMVFQNYALFPHLSVADNITFGLRVRKVPKAELQHRLEGAAQLLGLRTLLDRKPSQLSGGQQQRVALGRALVSRARVCLMDEPLSNLDAQLRQDMRRELRELQLSLGLTVIYVTHDQAEAMSMADQVVLLNHGRVEQAGAPRDLYAQPATTFAARFVGTPPMNLLAIDDGCISGSDVAIDVAPTTTSIGIRPESIELVDSGVPATVTSLEYLGADLVLHCRIGRETVLVRTSGRHRVERGAAVALRWAREQQHAFGADGRRIDTTDNDSNHPSREPDHATP